MYETRFDVQGKGAIPFDMLRYDSCFPASSADAAKIEAASSIHQTREERKAVRTITLVHRCERKDWEPTRGRWGSFMWAVVRGSEQQF
jgi:hypothetical protein